MTDFIGFKNHMKYLFYILLCLAVFSSCKKKTEVAGRVYSKNDIPVASAKINLWAYGSSKYSDISEVATTDADGYYHFSFKAKRNHYYDIQCANDSSYTNQERLVPGKSNNFDLKFLQ